MENQETEKIICTLSRMRDGKFATPEDMENLFKAMVLIRNYDYLKKQFLEIIE